MKRARIMLDNIPTEGSAKWIAVVISAITMSTGLYVAFEQEKDKRAQAKKTKCKKGREDPDTDALEAVWSPRSPRSTPRTPQARWAPKRTPASVKHSSMLSLG